MLQLQQNEKGIGVYTDTKIPCNTIIETCRCILTHVEIPESDELENYVFPVDSRTKAVVLGFGSMYNHSDEPNAMYVKDYDKGLMHYVSLDTIEAGEEICINYFGCPFVKQDENNKLWF